MQFKQDAKVVTAHGEGVGQLERVVIDPRTDRVTHIVVRRGMLFTEDKVLPVHLVASADDEQVRLQESAGNLKELPDFQEQYYIPLAGETASTSYSWGYVPPFYWYPPVGGPVPGEPGYYIPPYTVETEENIPDDAIPLKEGADVIGSNGEKVGSVARVLTDPVSNRITHFVISRGWLFTEEKLVPVNWVSDVAENEVRLAVGAEVLERVPEYDDR
jgi:uncharacterized protein YrrD